MKLVRYGETNLLSRNALGSHWRGDCVETARDREMQVHTGRLRNPLEPPSFGLAELSALFDPQ